MTWTWSHWNGARPCGSASCRDVHAERKAVLDLYIGAFSARQDAYVRDSRAHLNEPLDAELAELALVGGFALSGYLAFREGETFHTQVGAIDFDMSDGFQRATTVRSFLGSQGMDSLLVSSRRGGHLWVHTDWQPIPAAIMRRALTNALVMCDVPTEKAEVFPKRSRAEWGVGALRMPLMRHPKTGVIYPAHAPDDDSEVADVRTLVIVMADLVTSSEALRRLAGPEQGPDSYPRYTPVWGRPTGVRDDAPLVTQLLSELGVQAIPGRSVRCPFHEDDKASLQIAPDDLRAWCKSPECLLHNDGRGLGSVELADQIRSAGTALGKDTHSHAAHPQ